MIICSQCKIIRDWNISCYILILTQNWENIISKYALEKKTDFNQTLDYNQINSLLNPPTPRQVEKKIVSYK